MWQLAVHTNRLTEIVAASRVRETPLSDEELAEAKSIVDDVAKLTAALALDKTALRHPRVREGLPEFKDAITRAQAGLARDPPDLSTIQDLGASCRECHARGKQPVPFQL
jgi:hypothetical protein